MQYLSDLFNEPFLGSGEPTTTTNLPSSYVGRLYRDETEDRTFRCTNSGFNLNTWDNVSGGRQTAAPMLSGNTTGTEQLKVTITITNWSPTNFYTIYSSGGTFVNNNNGTITWVLPKSDGAILQHKIGVRSLAPSKTVSIDTIHSVAVNPVSATADQVLLYENATMTATQFPTTTTMNLTGNTLKATAIGSSATSAIVNQDGDDTDWVKAKPSMVSKINEYCVNGGKSNNSVVEFCHEMEFFQGIPTNGASDCESFTIGTDNYVVFSNLNNGATYNIDSKIYKWNGTTFVLFQSIATNGAYDCESFTIGTDIYIAFSNYYNGSTYNLNSTIYKWNGSTFVLFQSIATSGACDCESFKIGTDTYIVFSNYINDTTRNINSNIYKWNGSTFVLFQSIATNGARECESFTIGTDTYIAFSNNYNDSTYNVDSKIYKWNGTTFVLFQNIATNGASDCKSFTIGADNYIVFSNQNNGTNYNVDSKIYKWNGTTFVSFQNIATNGAPDCENFTVGTDTYIAFSNYYNGTTRNIDSKIYKWNGSTFVLFQSIATNGASDCKSFKIGTDTYIAFSNYYDDSTYNINSNIYKIKPMPSNGDKILLNDGVTTTLQEKTVVNADYNQRTIYISGYSFSSTPTIVAKDTQDLAISLVPTGGADDFVVQGPLTWVSDAPTGANTELLADVSFTTGFTGSWSNIGAAPTVTSGLVYYPFSATTRTIRQTLNTTIGATYKYKINISTITGSWIYLFNDLTVVDSAGPSTTRSELYGTFVATASTHQFRVVFDVNTSGYFSNPSAVCIPTKITQTFPDYIKQGRDIKVKTTGNTDSEVTKIQVDLSKIL
jgi:hypothetical protein